MIDPLSSLFRSIHYKGREWLKTLQHNNNEYVHAFSNVTRLELPHVYFNNLHLIPDFKLLGSQIQKLTFACCTMPGVDQLVSCLLPFNNLGYLAISNKYLVEVGAEVREETSSRALPPFPGMLSLSQGQGNGGEIPNMEHSRIILRDHVEWVPSPELLSTFLSKF